MSDDTRIGLEARPGPPAPMVYVAIFGKLVVLSAALVGLNMVDFAAYDLAFFGYFFQVVFTLAQLAIIATAFMDLPFEEYWNGLLVGFAVMAAALFLVLSVIDANTRGYADPATGNGVVAAELQRVSGLLSAIYREMALVIRSSANKLEGSQAELTRLVRRLIKRSDAQSANATHQILLLRNLLRYMGKDEEQLRQILDQVAREEAPADEEEAP